jgi:hypothetical protein
MSDKRKEIWETLDTALTKSISNAYATGQSDERERIIKLLEDNLAAAAPKPDIIALIKGESNGNV